jgi:hypothetical protein
LAKSPSQQKRPSNALTTPPRAFPKSEHVAEPAIESAIKAAHEAGKIRTVRERPPFHCLGLSSRRTFPTDYIQTSGRPCMLHST